MSIGPMYGMIEICNIPLSCSTCFGAFAVYLDVELIQQRHLTLLRIVKVCSHIFFFSDLDIMIYNIYFEGLSNSTFFDC